jgi:AcrR family transcriptional regulator
MPGAASYDPTVGGPPAEEPSVAGEPGRRVRLDRDQRRQTLLDAAAAAFAERGFQATSMEEIASRAGVTRLIVYRHFDSKEDLYRSVLDRAVAGIIVAVRGELAGGRTVEGVVKGFLDAGRAYPDGFRLLVRHSAREPDFGDYAERFRENAVRAAQELIARPVPDAVLRAWSAKTLVALLEEATLAWIESGDSTRDEEMKAVLTSSIHGMLGAFAALT